MRLFLIVFVLILSALASLTAGCVAISGHFFHGNMAAWTDTSAWSSRPFIAGAILTLLSLLGASIVSTLVGFAKRILSGGPRPKKVRPRSNRPTLS